VANSADENESQCAEVTEEKEYVIDCDLVGCEFVGDRYVICGYEIIVNPSKVSDPSHCVVTAYGSVKHIKRLSNQIKSRMF